MKPMTVTAITMTPEQYDKGMLRIQQSHEDVAWIALQIIEELKQQMRRLENENASLRARRTAAVAAQ